MEKLPSSIVHAAYSAYAVQLVTVLLIIAVAVATAVKWIRVPYSVALVIVGLIIGIFQILPQVNITPDLILLVFLPPLLFEAAWNLDLQELKTNWLPVTILATVGVILTLFVSAFVLSELHTLPMIVACTFGAIIAATDPISVLSIFRQMGIDKRLTMLLEGESLFNDGTAVVLFGLMLAAVANPTHISLPLSIIEFLLIAAGGLTLGALAGWLVSQFHRFLDDHLLETMITAVLAYGIYLIADKLHVSSVLAVVASGIVLGNACRKSAMSEKTKLAVDTFWDFAAFAVNSLVFLLIGLQIRMPLLVKYGSLIGMGILAMLLSRVVVVYVLCPLISTKTKPINYRWRAVLFWGALRGSLSMAMALSLPLNFPEREALIIMTFGAVLFTLLVQGLTTEPLVHLLKIDKSK